MQIVYEGQNLDAGYIQQRVFDAHPELIVTDAAGRRSTEVVTEGSADGTWVRVTMPDDLLTPEQVQAIIDGSRALTLTATKPVIVANGTDETVITCSGTVISGDASLRYTVMLDGQEYTAPGDVPVAGGQAQLALSTLIPGVYTVTLYRKGTVSYQSGFITITAKVS